MAYEFRWNGWNLEHIEEHGVTPEEAEQIVRGAKPPYPRSAGAGKYIVRGRTESGDYLQVVFIEDPEDVTYVIHARPLTDREKRNYRRGRT
jgi:uncharacterized DUF497 family protein